MNESIFGIKKDQYFMNIALEQARIALKFKEVPVGAIVVNQNGDIVSQAHNRVEQNYSQAAHAEIEAIRYATRELKNWRLDWHWIYVTLEPCPMCMGCIQLSRFAGLVYAASSYEKTVLDRDCFSWLYNKNKIVIISGIQQIDSSELLQSFFQQKRTIKERSSEEYKRDKDAFDKGSG